MSSPHSPHPLDSARKGMSLFLILCNAWAESFLVFLRTGFGSRFQEATPAFTLVLMVVWTLYFMEQGHSPIPMMIFGALFLVTNACHQLAAHWRRFWQIPDQEHSEYSGTSRLHRVFPWLSEQAIKLRIEPTFITLLGGLLWIISFPLGLYFAIGAFCMNAAVALPEQWQRQQAQRMHDLMIDQQQMSARLRNTRDNCRSFEPWTPARDAFATAFFGPREPHLNELWAMSEEMA